jgi:hypothetical protein
MTAMKELRRILKISENQGDCGGNFPANLP